jgi:hypothetical protein
VFLKPGNPTRGPQRPLVGTCKKGYPYYSEMEVKTIMRDPYAHMQGKKKVKKTDDSPKNGKKILKIVISNKKNLSKPKKKQIQMQLPLELEVKLLKGEDVDLEDLHGSCKIQETWAEPVYAWLNQAKGILKNEN